MDPVMDEFQSPAVPNTDTLNADLATLRDSLTGGHSGRTAKGLDALDRVEAELSRLRELCVAIDTGTFDTQRERAEAAEAELSRLRKQRDATMRSYESCLGTLRKAVETAEAAEARCAELQGRVYALETSLPENYMETLGDAEARCARLQQALDGARRWFRERPWEGHPDTGSFGGQGYSTEERDLGYGTWRDPRFLPEALAGVDTPQKCESCARLQQALAGLESAVRILDVMLREPAAEGLMSAEDYRSYVQGAWLGVDEAAEKAREALAGPDAQTSGSGSSAADPSVGERQGRQPDPGEIAGLLVELSRWSRVAELNGDLHARIASALAVPDTPEEEA